MAEIDMSQNKFAHRFAGLAKLIRATNEGSDLCLKRDSAPFSFSPTLAPAAEAHSDIDETTQGFVGLQITPASPLGSEGSIDSYVGFTSFAKKSIDNGLLGSTSYEARDLSFASSNTSGNNSAGSFSVFSENSVFFGDAPVKPSLATTAFTSLESIFDAQARLSDDLQFALQLEGILDITTPPPTPIEGYQFAEDGGFAEDFHNLMFDEACICVLPDYLISEIEGNAPQDSWEVDYGVAFDDMDDVVSVGYSNFNNSEASCSPISQFSGDKTSEGSCDMGSPLLPADLFTPSSIGSSDEEPSSFPFELPEDIEFESFVGENSASSSWDAENGYF